jgi:hypothetical protein
MCVELDTQEKIGSIITLIRVWRFDQVESADWKKFCAKKGGKGKTSV